MLYLIKTNYVCKECGNFNNKSLITTFDKETFHEKIERCVADKDLRIDSIFHDDSLETIVNGISYKAVANITRFNVCSECKHS